MRVTRACLVLLLSLMSCPSAFASAPRQMELLDRGVVAVPTATGAMVSWRILAGEPETLAFNVYRSVDGAAPQLITPEPQAGPTCLRDPESFPGLGVTYSVEPVGDGAMTNGGTWTIDAQAPREPYLTIPLRTPEGYTPNDGSVADLDGDGQYEFVLHQTGVGHDNSHSGYTDPPILQAYELDGTLLWEIDLGINIREGAHYTQFMVYDLDGDGRAEVVCKTADGTTDGRGIVIGDRDADHRNSSGYILAGPEYLTVFDGLTGRALATTDYTPPRHPDTQFPSSSQLNAVWGDGYGNRCDRFLACVAYLDGVHPSVVMCRGYYTRTVLAAWDWREGELTQRWVFDSDTPGNGAYAGQGNHGLSVADVDDDGRDEILYGGMAIDDDGTGLYSTRLGHGDAMHVSDLDPTRPGLEVFRIQEPVGDAGVHMFDAATGEILWRAPTTSGSEGPGRGVAFDIDPRYQGNECWAAGGGIRDVFSAQGNVIGAIGTEYQLSMNMASWWDGDVMRELLDGVTIKKWKWNVSQLVTLLDGGDYGCASNNGTKATPVLTGDILGDWREEVIWRAADSQSLRVFVTPILTSRRFYTFMQDPQYRLAIAWQNVGYNQPPHPSFFVGAGMEEPPLPDIEMIKPTRKPVTLQNADFEQGPLGATPEGWVPLEGDVYSTTSVETAGDPGSAATGERFLTATWQGTGATISPFPESQTMLAYQDADLSPLASDIDGGGRAFRLWYAVAENDPSDFSVVRLEFLDDGGDRLAPPTTRVGLETPTGLRTWQRRSLASPIPPGARTVRVTLGAGRTGIGSARNVSFDDLEAEVILEADSPSTACTSADLVPAYGSVDTADLTMQAKLLASGTTLADRDQRRGVPDLFDLLDYLTSHDACR